MRELKTCRSYFLLISLKVIINMCETKHEGTEYNGIKCNIITRRPSKSELINLIEIDDLQDEGNQEWMNTKEEKMFFIESSGKDHLSSKQVCAIESAVRNARVSNIILAMTSKVLRIGGNNATCQLVTKLLSGDNPRVYVRHVDVSKLIAGTPIEEAIFENENNAIEVCHYSDAIRLILLQRYGGWYSDLDMVIIRDLSGFKNVIASDNVSQNDTSGNLGSGLSNAIFHNEAGHPFVSTAVNLHKKIFDGTWATGGSILMTETLKEICKSPSSSHGKIDLNLVNQKDCKGLKILPPKSFFPVPWYEATTLWKPKKTEKQWLHQFSESLGVHFYHSSWKYKEEIQWPETYEDGAFPAYLALAINYCPVSFYSDESF